MKTDNFITYLEKYSPYLWTIIKSHPDKFLENNDMLLINFERFRLITKMIDRFQEGKKIFLDLGVYPGIVPQICFEHLSLKPQIFYGLGLGFHEEFQTSMTKLGITLLECDLDPRLHLDEGRATIIPLEAESVDFVVFTDVVEHFFDPFYPLQEINRVSQNGAIMVLTTNNITRFRAFLGMLRGRSCNVPLINGSLFYNGDWRPHFREYSKGELYQLMEWAGFEVLEHRFYEAEFGQYRVVDGQLVKKDLRMLSIKGKLVDEVQKLSTKVLPHLCDNHILVARKVKSYDEMLAKAPRVVSDIDDWVNQRQAFGS